MSLICHMGNKKKANVTCPLLCSLVINVGNGHLLPKKKMRN